MAGTNCIAKMYHKGILVFRGMYMMFRVWMVFKANSHGVMKSFVYVVFR